MTTAQRVTPPELVGKRVRMTSNELEPDRQIGTLVNAYPDSLYFLSDGANRTVSIPVSDVDQLEESHGRQRQWKLGMLLGAAAGIGVAIYAEDIRDWVSPSKPAYFGLGALVGSLYGGIAGLLVRREKWERAELQPVSAVVRDSVRLRSVSK